jgi:hypothetical protein
MENISIAHRHVLHNPIISISAATSMVHTVIQAVSIGTIYNPILPHSPLPISNQSPHLDIFISQRVLHLFFLFIAITSLGEGLVEVLMIFQKRIAIASDISAFTLAPLEIDFCIKHTVVYLKCRSHYTPLLVNAPY